MQSVLKNYILLQIMKISGVQIVMVDGKPSHVDLPEETWAQLDKQFFKFKKSVFKFAAEVGAIYGLQLHCSCPHYVFIIISMFCSADPVMCDGAGVQKPQKRQSESSCKEEGLLVMFICAGRPMLIVMLQFFVLTHLKSLLLL